VTVADLCAAVVPGDWVVGEIEGPARAALEAAGAMVAPAAACLRRPGWLAALGVSRAESSFTAARLGELVPDYPRQPS
jgi:hypothetical protein